MRNEPKTTPNIGDRSAGFAARSRSANIPIAGSDLSASSTPNRSDHPPTGITAHIRDYLARVPSEITIRLSSTGKIFSFFFGNPLPINKNPPKKKRSGHFFALRRAEDLRSDRRTEQPSVAGDMVNKSASGDLLRKWHAGDNIHALPAFT